MKVRAKIDHYGLETGKIYEVIGFPGYNSIQVLNDEKRIITTYNPYIRYSTYFTKVDINPLIKIL